MGVWIVGGRGGEFTGWVGGFEDPVCVFSVGYYLVVPFDLEMAGGFLDEGRAGEGVDI